MFRFIAIVSATASFLFLYGCGGGSEFDSQNPPTCTDEDTLELLEEKQEDFIIDTLGSIDEFEDVWVDNIQEIGTREDERGVYRRCQADVKVRLHERIHKGKLSKDVELIYKY